MTPTEGYVYSNGIELHYVEWGVQGSPPLIAIHPTGFLSWIWQPVAERLASNWRVIANDQRGHGDSAKPEGGYNFETLARDLQGIIEALGLEKPVGVGHSSGGTTLLTHAALFPGVFRGLVVIEPIIPPPEWRHAAQAAAAEMGERTPNSLRDRTLKRRNLFESKDEMYRAFRDRDPFQTWTDEAFRLYTGHGLAERPDGRFELKCPPPIEALFYEAVGHFRPEAFLSKVTCPVLALWGGESHLARSGMKDYVERDVPGAVTRILDGMTHFPPMERPDAVAEAVEEFFGALAAT